MNFLLVGGGSQGQGRDPGRGDRGVRLGLHAAHHRVGQPLAHRARREVRPTQHW